MAKSSNQKLLITILMAMLGMAALTAASVPLYRIFCKATGYGGSVEAALDGADRVGKRRIKVLFDSNTAKDLPWSFKTQQRHISVQTGENAIVFYHAKNESSEPVTGMAVYNITPHKAGKYFKKIACFCFERQLLLPGQEMLMPVTFFIDPAIEDDKDMWDVSTITLSYSFFRLD